MSSSGVGVREPSDCMGLLPDRVRKFSGSKRTLPSKQHCQIKADFVQNTPIVFIIQKRRGVAEAEPLCAAKDSTKRWSGVVGGTQPSEDLEDKLWVPGTFF